MRRPVYYLSLRRSLGVVDIEASINTSRNIPKPLQHIPSTRTHRIIPIKASFRILYLLVFSFISFISLVA